MSKKMALHEYLLVIGLVLVMGVSLGCAARDASGPETETTRKSPADNASLTAAGTKDGKQSRVETAQQDTRRIQIEPGDHETRLRLPIGREINVDTQYEGSQLVLSCAPALRGPLDHDDLSGTVLKGVQFSTIPGTDRIEEIRIRFKRQASYSLSRIDARTMALTLTPQDTVEANTTGTGGLRQLKNINFYETEKGGLKIVLTGGESLEYKLQPSENDELNLALPGTQIPSPQTKLYNLEKFNSPVQKALLSNSPSGGRVHLSMDQRLPVKIRRKRDDLILAVAPRQENPRDSESVQLDVNPGKNKTEKQTAKNESASSASGNETLAQFQNTLGDGLIIPGLQDQYSGKPISIDVQNAKVSHVLRLISDVGNFNLVMDQGVGGTITLKLKQVPWDQVLDNILRQKSLGMKKVGNRILRIAPIDKLRQEQQRNIQVRKSAKEAEKSKEDLAPLQTEYIQINYSNAQDLQSQVKKFLSDRGEVSHDPRTNQLIVSDTEQNLAKIKSVVNKLDRAERQVLIEARIVYATETFTENLGLRWGGGYAHQSNDKSGGVYGTGATPQTPGALEVGSSGYAVNLLPQQGSATLGLGGFLSKVTGADLYALDAQLQIGESENQVKTISKPKVVTLNNQ